MKKLLFGLLGLVTILTLAGCLEEACCCCPCTELAPAPKVSIQLYSLRNDCEKDFKGVLTALAKMGYDGVELAGFYGHEPAEVKAWCDELGLTIISAHVERKVLAADPEGQAALYAGLGCKYVAFPWADKDADLPGAPGYQAFLQDIRNIHAAMAKQGITLLYHSHDFEFGKLGDRYLLDILLADTAAQGLGSELDTCWCHVGGVDPCAYMRAHGDRMPVVHFKDYVGVPGGAMYNLIGKDPSAGDKSQTFEYRPLGEGKLDLAAMAATARAIGTRWIVVEQDDPSAGTTALECAGKSIVNLRKNL